MSSTPFEVKVVYDASRRRRGAPVVRTARAGSTRAAGGLALMAGALLNLAVAGAMYYATWWRADPHIYLVFMTKLPLDVSREFAANPLGLSAASFEALEPVVEEPPVDAGESDAAPRWSAKTAQIIIPITAYSWLTLATAAACAVALAGGAWLGVAGGSRARRLGWIGALAMAVFLGYTGFQVWQESQRMFDPNKLRLGMGLLSLLFALVGVPLAGRARGLTRFAGATMIVTALASAAALWLWARSGAVDVRYAAGPELSAVFAIPAVWGLILWLAATRART